MFGKPDRRDAEIAFLREQVKTLQDKLIALADVKAAAYLNQANKPPYVPSSRPIRPLGPQAFREQGVRVRDGKLISDTDEQIEQSFKIE